ncbi:MAG: hypothetical protein RRB13_11905 [bacterium]|nr:hypothetical protein [bacterium]
MIQLPPFKWWLQGPLAQAWRKAAESVWQGFEGWVIALFESASVEHATATGLEIRKRELVISPPKDLSNEAQRLFVQYQADILRDCAKPRALALPQSILGLNVWHKDPASNSPFFYLRYWVDADQAPLVTELFGILAPARCVKHAHLVAYDGTPAGFGGTAFGLRFGDQFLDFETLPPAPSAGFGLTPLGANYGG